MMQWYGVGQPFLIGWEPLYNKLIHEVHRKLDGKHKLSKSIVTTHNSRAHSNNVSFGTTARCVDYVSVHILDVLVNRFHCTSINNIHVKKFFTSHTIIVSTNKILGGAHCIEIDREMLESA